MIFIESPSTDPHFNLALEQYVFDTMDPKESYFMLWQNDNAIIIGKHQNTIQEINAEFVQEKGIKVVRRLSGGGAVYHDLGNLNFTFIVPAEKKYGAFNFADFCVPVVDTLRIIGVHAEISGRNDMTIEGKKFSGNSQYAKRGKIMHHGTIMYDSDLDVVTDSLKVSGDKIKSKGVSSIRNRVTNIKPHLSEDISLDEFKGILVKNIFNGEEVNQYHLTEQDIENVNKIKDEIYSTWEWNYGFSPQYSIIKEQRFPNVGKLEVHMEVEEGIIKQFDVCGDYFGNGDKSELQELLIGKLIKPDVIARTLENVDIGHYFNNLEKEEFINLIL